MAMRWWKKYRNCNPATFMPLLIRAWGRLIRWHTRSLAQRWRLAGNGRPLHQGATLLLDLLHLNGLHEGALISTDLFLAVEKKTSPEIAWIFLNIKSFHWKDSRCMGSFCKTCRSTSSKSDRAHDFHLITFPGNGIDFYSTPFWGRVYKWKFCLFVCPFICLSICLSVITSYSFPFSDSKLI